MPKITEVIPQKKNPKRFNIFLDGQFAFGADEDLVVEHRLVPDKQLDTSDVEQLLFEAEVGKLMERVYRLFNIRQRSEKEIRDYLKNLSFKRKVKGQEEISPFIINAAIELMKKKGLIDDVSFAKAWVESRSKKRGPRLLKQELFQKGIDKEIIEDVINNRRTDYDGQRIAEQLLEKKMRVWRNLPKIEFRKKAYDFLLRRGFEYETIRATIEKFLQKR